MLFTPDGKGLLGEVTSGKMCIWEVPSGKLLRTFTGYQHNLSTRAFSPDGARLVTCTAQMRLFVWDVRKGKLLSSPQGPEGYFGALAFSPDSKYVLTGNYDPLVRLWDVRTMRLVRSFPWLPEVVALGVAFSADGKKAAAVGGGKFAVVWDVGTGKTLHRLDVPPSMVPYAVVFSPDSLTLFAAGYTGDVLRWDLKTGKALAALKCDSPQPLRDLQISPTGKQVVAHSMTGLVSFWNVTTGKHLGDVQGPNSQVMSSRLSPDGKTIASINAEGKAGLFRAGDGRAVRAWQGGWAWAMRYSPDGKFLAATGNSVLRLWRADTGKELCVLASGPADMHTLAFSSDGRWLATAGDSTSVLIWDADRLLKQGRFPTCSLSSGEWQQRWLELGDTSAAVWPEAQAILAAGRDQTVRRMRAELLPPLPDARLVKRLLARLDSDDSAVQKRAMDDLTALGSGVRPLLEKSLKGTTDADVRLRLLVVLARLRKVDSATEARQAERGVQLLRRVGTKAARELLRDLARGPDTSPWTKAARGVE
jgi:WD40 repeat protein